MKKQYLLIGLLLMFFVFGNSIYAVQVNNPQGQNQQQSQQQVQQSTQTVNQGEASQVQTQTNNPQTGEQNQQQSQQQVQQQEQQNLQNKSKAGIGLENAEQRRSQVANAVQEMLQVAERNGGVGEQVRVIAQAQNQNQEKIENGLQKVQNRSGLIKFFAGPDYAEIDNIQRIMEQNRFQIQQLNKIKDQLVSQEDQQAIIEQVQLLEQANLMVENILDNSRKGFSLFGWLFRMFND